MDRHGANGFSRQSIETGGLRGTWTQTTSPFLITGGRLRVLSKRKDGFARTTTKSRLSGNGPVSAARMKSELGNQIGCLHRSHSKLGTPQTKPCTLESGGSERRNANVRVRHETPICASPMLPRSHQATGEAGGAPT